MKKILLLLPWLVFTLALPLAYAALSTLAPQPSGAAVVVPLSAQGQIRAAAMADAVAITPTTTIAALIETTPVTHTGDAADDPAIWVHPTDLSLSTILGTDKKGGVVVYDLTGAEIQYRADGNMNNIDLRYNFSLGGRAVTLVTAGNRSNNSIAIYQVNPTTRWVEPVGTQLLTNFEVYGSCMYHSPTTGKYYVFVNNKAGQVQQWELLDGGSQVGAQLVRSFAVSSQVEGCVADDELGYFYLGEEAVGIWKYGAEPGDGLTGTLIDTTANGHVVSNVEGLTIYYASDGTGYLIASSQGNNTFAIYERQGQNAFVRTFSILAGNGIDAVSGTDGIDVMNVGLGTVFSQGVFIAQDGTNDVGNQNFKLVSWAAIANAGIPPLTIDPGWDPREVGRTPTLNPAEPRYHYYLPAVVSS